MKPQFAPDADQEGKFNTWIGVVNTEIDNVSREYSNLYDGTLFHKFKEIKEGFNKFVENVREIKNLIWTRFDTLAISAESIYDQLIKIQDLITSSTSDREFLGPLNILTSNIKNLQMNFANNFYFETPDLLSESEFLFVSNQITLKGIPIENYITLDIYKNSKPNQKSDITNNLIEIRNLLRDYFGGEYNSRIENKLGEITSIVELINLNDNIQEIKDSSEILKQIKQNASTENTMNLNNGYAEEATILKTRIDKLEKYIVALFMTIIVTIAFKIIFLLFDLDGFKNIYNFLTFISLILSCSALIAYFVKDRNRLIKIHDHYKMNVLEISTMPEYMRELDKVQRQQLIIDLSHNYFRGTPNEKEVKNEKTSELESIKSTVSDIAKMVSDMKEVLKK